MKVLLLLLLFLLRVMMLDVRVGECELHVACQGDAPRCST